MKLKLKLLVAASAFVLTALTAQANLVLNPGFEFVTVGAPDDWTTGGAFTMSSDFHSGSLALELLPGGGTSFQGIPTPTPPYLLSFWVKDVADVGALTLIFDGVLVEVILASSIPVGPVAENGYHQISRIVSPAAISLLQFSSTGGDFRIDDVSLVAVPEATTMIAGALLLLPFGASTLRILRRNRTATA